LVSLLLLLLLLLLCWLWGGGGQYFKDPRSEAHVSSLQRLSNISAKIMDHGGLCSNGDASLTATSNLYNKNSVSYRDRINKFFVDFDATGTVVASHGDANVQGLPSPIESDDIPKVLSFMETAVGTLCLNTPTPNPSPDNDTSPAQLSGSVALGFFERQGNTIG
jgi:hypothetical protein